MNSQDDKSSLNICFNLYCKQEKRTKTMAFIYCSLKAKVKRHYIYMYVFIASLGLTYRGFLDTAITHQIWQLLNLLGCKEKRFDTLFSVFLCYDS